MGFQYDGEREKRLRRTKWKTRKRKSFYLLLVFLQVAASVDPPSLDIVLLPLSFITTTGAA